MKTTLSLITKSALTLAALTLLPAEAQLVGQLGVLDVTANGGINPATGVAWAEGDQYRLIFLSSTTTDAMSSDITTYNSFVQETAEGSTAFPDLGTATWNMLGSTLTVDARDNTGTNPNVEAGVPIFLMDGASLFAANNASLWATASLALNLDENGVVVANGRVFTGSFTNGTGVGAGSGGGANGDGMGSGDTALGVLDGQGVQSGLPTGNIVGREFDFWIRQWKHPAASPLPVYAISEPLTVITGVPFTLAITTIDYSSANSELNLTWSSKPDETYVVTYSSDMVDWSERLHSGVLTSGGTETTETFDLAELDLPNLETLFFRVERAVLIPNVE